MANQIKTVAVFCGSRFGKNAYYSDIFNRVAYQTGYDLVKRGYNVIYGGGKAGMMGAVAQGGLDAKRDHQSASFIKGITVSIFDAKQGLSPEGVIHVTARDMFDRKREMAEEAEAFIVLGGGIGTLDELGDITNLNNIAHHIDVSAHYKPAILVDTPIEIKGVKASIYRGIIAQIRDMVEVGMAHEACLDYVQIVSEPDQGINLLDEYNRSGRIPISKYYPAKPYTNGHKPVNGNLIALSFSMPANE